MKVLVTGYAGQLGWDTVHQLEARGVECRGVDIQDFSLTDAQAVKNYVLDYRPDAVVHCAAYTNVDKAESEPERFKRIDAAGSIEEIKEKIYGCLEELCRERCI